MNHQLKHQSNHQLKPQANHRLKQQATKQRARSQSSDPPEIGNRVFMVGVFFFVFFLGCAGFMLEAGREYKTHALVVSSLWVIGVPIFFFCEHAFIYRKWGDPAEFDQFKRLQDTAAKIWAAAVLVLAALLAHGEMKAPPPCCIVPAQASTAAPAK
ncbi:hypothetical protein [Variovorax sp. JS1663]|uniref:hypothetical protein n=1 Tax=Variovorax sp. JS1663 TaxID=1851577 RepID=UPI00117D24B0|nr:hypothetical protein [Variovorax sp. JS1663]